MPLIGQVLIDLLLSDNTSIALLLFQCENIVEEFEEGMIKYFSKEHETDLDVKICSEHAKLCNIKLPENEDYEFENDEL